MNYDSMTKVELINLLNEQKHLSQAVQAKDKEINELLTEVKELKQRIKHETVPKDKYDAVNESLKGLVPKGLAEELQEKLRQFEGSMTKENLDKFLEKVEEERKRAFDIAAAYKTSYEDILRVFKVNLDMAITTSDLLSEKVKTNKKT